MTRAYRRRYIAFKVDSPRPLNKKDVVVLLKSILDEGAPSISLITYDPETMRGILRCDHRDVNMVRILLNTPLQGDVVLTTLKTSGTLKALRRKLSDPSSEKRKPTSMGLRKGF
mgnify:CR=1 FL=1